MSIEQGLALVLTFSLLVEIVVCALFSTAMRFAMAFLIPFLASVGLYWLPNLTALHNAEFRGWFPVFFVVWFLPSTAACLIAAAIATWLRRRIEKRNTRSI
jgi:hypothetical protein